MTPVFLNETLDQWSEYGQHEQSDTDMMIAKLIELEQEKTAKEKENRLLMMRYKNMGA